jgi:hypothetical protein
VNKFVTITDIKQLQVNHCYVCILTNEGGGVIFLYDGGTLDGWRQHRPDSTGVPHHSNIKDDGVMLSLRPAEADSSYSFNVRSNSSVQGYRYAKISELKDYMVLLREAGISITSVYTEEDIIPSHFKYLP